MLKNITLLFFALICICNSAFSASINLSPHRAVYDLSLVKSGSDKTIKSASGRIALEFSGNICQGFSFLLRQITNISDGEGAHKRVDMRVQNWENAKGTDLKFKSITREGDQIIQQSEGRALRDDAGEVSLSLHRPHLLKVDMDGKALFPTAHIRKLIEIGEQGDNFFSTKAYDGG